MFNTELVKTLRILTKNQQQRFILFLKSPYCTEEHYSRSAIRICEHVFACLEQEEILLEESAVYAAIYPDKDDDSNHDLSNLRSRCLKFLKKFMITEQFSKSMVESEEHLWLSRFYAEQGQANYAERELNWLESWQSESRTAWRDRDYLTSLQVAECKSYFLSKYSSVKKNVELIAYLKELEMFYMHLSIKYTTLLYGFSNVNKVELKSISDNIKIDIKEVQYSSYFSTEIGALSKLAIQLINPFEIPNHTIYQKYVEVFNQIKDLLNPNDLSNFETYARSYLLRKFNIGHIEVLPDIFKMQKAAFLDANNGYESKYIASLFASTIRSAVFMKKLDWANDLFESQKDKIKAPVEQKGEVLAYCSALLAFKHKNYDTAQEILLTSQFNDFQIKWHVRTLEVQLLFESQPELAESKIQAVKMFFKRNEHLTEERKTGFLNFLKIVKRLLNPKVRDNKKKLLAILDEVTNEPILYERFWLFEILEEKLEKWN